jgi:hypothetical protein
MHRADEYGDHLHEVRWNNDTDQPEPVSHFDLDAIRFDDEPEPEDETITVADASSAILRCLYWCAGADGHDGTPQSRLLGVAARVEALLWLLNPNESRFANMTEIARAAGVTKACLSKSLLTFKDQIGLRLSGGKRHYARATHGRAQRAAVAAGCHSSQRKGKGA